MADGPRYAVPYRRRREARTDYKLRRALIRSGLPRAVVRLTNQYVIVQVSEAQAKGDVVRASASSKELSKLGWKGGAGNLPAAYLTGLLAAQRAVAHGVKKAVLDIGLRGPTRGSKVFAALKGLSDSGLVVPHSDASLPPADRINGSHIAGYAKSLAGQQELYRKQFAGYLEKGLKPEDLSNHFEQVRKSLISASVGGS